MKKIVLTITVLLISASLPLYAGVKTAMPKGNWNPISIYNHTKADVAYEMDGSYGGAIYGIKAKNVDIYHSGTGDEYATFDVGACNELPNNGGACTKPDNVVSCTGTTHYNADLIKQIDIYSVTSCKITCLDGGDASCKQSG